MRNAAITGGTGFVGAALIEQLLAQGWSVRALARDPARLPHRERVSAVTGDLDDAAALADLAEGADVFFHLAGITHAKRIHDYHAVNVTGARNAAHACAKANKGAGALFVHTSSMSARAPHVSPYADSKRSSEDAVREASGANSWLALRLPAIYGPRDRVALPFFKLVNRGLALEPKTPQPARASIAHVDDAAGALLAAAISAPPGAVYEVGDDCENGRAWAEIGAVLADVLGQKTRAVAVPRPLIAAYYGLMRAVEGALGRTPSVREGQVEEFFHPDWVARDNLLSDACSWRAQIPLQEGFAKTVLWYQKHGLL